MLSNNKIFSELTVLELASVLAGPDVGMFFAELGATVIKVENKKTNGDVTRKWKLPVEDPNRNISAYFCSVNYRKQYVQLDFSDTNDFSTLTQLIKKSDIIITNFKPGDDKKFRLDFASIQQWQPHIIYAQLTGFGEENPRVAFDLVLQAETGFMSINGTPESSPLKMPVALIDVLAAHQLKEGIVTALWLQTRRKKPYKVSVSLYDAAVSSLKNQATNWLMAHQVPQPLGSLHPNIAPYGETFYTKDQKPVVLAIGSDKQFAQLLNILQCDELLSDPKFSTNRQRVKNRTRLAKILSKAIGQFNRNELLQQTLQENIPLSPVLRIDEVFENPQAQSLILEETIDNIPTQRVKTAVFKIE